jgi:phi13 family phage major tail protein
MAIKGLRGFRYCKLTTDSETTLEYDSVIKKLLGARNVKISPKVNTGELYGDDQLLETSVAIGAIEVEIDVAELTLQERADWLGYTYENGVLTETKDFNPPFIALGFEAPKSDGQTRMKWLLKGKAEPLEEEGKTQEDKVEFQTQKVKLKFMPRVHDGKSAHTCDTGETGAPTADKFFASDFLKTGKVSSL